METRAASSLLAGPSFPPCAVRRSCVCQYAQNRGAPSAPGLQRPPPDADEPPTPCIPLWLGSSLSQVGDCLHRTRMLAGTQHPSPRPSCTALSTSSERHQRPGLLARTIHARHYESPSSVFCDTSRSLRGDASDAVGMATTGAIPASGEAVSDRAGGSGATVAGAGGGGASGADAGGTVDGDSGVDAGGTDGGSDHAGT